jgi:hypothetical protein
MPGSKLCGSLAVAIVLLVAPLVAEAQQALPELRRQPTPQAVLDEHFEALNRCDWNRLLAQYPESAQIHLAGGTVVQGRAAIGDLFAGFCKSVADGGFAGLQFRPERNTLIGNTFVTQWIAEAAFLSEPYRGSDAYVTHDGYLAAMVTTFDGAALRKR